MTDLDLYSECNRGPWNENAETDTQWALRDRGDRHFILVFPPTQSRQDWLQNFDFLATPYKRMPRAWKAHRGWVAKYQSVRDDILQAIQAADPLFLTVTGFSQGAALATLAYEDVAFSMLSSGILWGAGIEGMVFGAPRVVSWTAPSERWLGFYRYQVRGDIVGMIPPFLFGFKHVGRVLKIGPRHFPDPMRHAAYADCLKVGA